MLLLKVFFAIAFTCRFSDFVSAPAAIAVPPSTTIRPTANSTRPRRFNLLILLSMLLTLPLSHTCACSAEEALPWSNVFDRSWRGQGAGGRDPMRAPWTACIAHLGSGAQS